MTIYADRKDGKLTGKFRIEVYRNGKRLRGRADDMAKAKAIEQSLVDTLAGLPAPAASPKPAPAPVVTVTLADARKRANGILWHGQKTEIESFQKLDLILRHLDTSMPVDAFDANVLDDLMIQLKDRGCSDARINRYLSTISSFMGFCRKRGLRTLPVPELDWLDNGEGRVRWLTYLEEKALMALLPPKIALLVHIAIQTGMRASELLDLEEAQVESRWVRLWETKNGSARSVPLTPELHASLKSLLAQGMPKYRELRNAWQEARETLGLSDDTHFTFHACRHSFATRAVEAGVNIRVLQKLMGHKTIQTTLRYAHVEDATLHDAALSAIAFHASKGGAMGGAIAA